MYKAIAIISIIFFVFNITHIGGEQSDLKKTEGVSIGSIYKFSMETSGNLSDRIHKFDQSFNNKYEFSIEIENIDDEGYVYLKYTKDQNYSESIEISLRRFGDPIVYTDWDYWEKHPTDRVYIKPPNETRTIENRDNDFYHKLDRYYHRPNRSKVPSELVYSYHGYEDIYNKNTGIMIESNIVVEKQYRNDSHTRKSLHFKLISPSNNSFSLPYPINFLTLVPLFFGTLFRRKFT